ncbi:hypothetical protein [Stenomitos frigidus]|uniref:Uncharacterized protein n=1 Tax=Stenomitos frigidus ULC18 TaxID=2107698 RepID=A0A2T1EHP8_9CYAN|nr:hypothetical protein [Stenomitos frigidus]PSB32211.1 hypothetical protein C7B82_06115 [Stenomitos frigidus ULC18]
MKTQQMIYQALELFSTSEPNPVQPQLTLGMWLREMWQDLMDVVTYKPELKVWQSVDRSGNLWWNGYNPATGDSVVLESEQEVRIWLAQSFCR